MIPQGFPQEDLKKNPAHGTQSPTQKPQRDPITGKSKCVKHIVVAELNTTEHRKAPANC